MKKYIFITNGSGGCGKDTFATFLADIVPTVKYSSIDRIKSIAGYCGWKGQKAEKDRKFLSDLKCLTTEYNDMPFQSISERVDRFKHDKKLVVMLIDIREPLEIERAKNAFGAATILIKRDSVAPITSNMADANVNNYEYDFEIENNGTLEEFKETVEKFAEMYIDYSPLDRYKEALLNIEDQMADDYIDMSEDYDPVEFEIIKEALELYKEKYNEKGKNENETEVK